jgi:hypothetical protein
VTPRSRARYGPYPSIWSLRRRRSEVVRGRIGHQRSLKATCQRAILPALWGTRDEGTLPCGPQLVGKSEPQGEARPVRLTTLLVARPVVLLRSALRRSTEAAADARRGGGHGRLPVLGPSGNDDRNRRQPHVRRSHRLTAKSSQPERPSDRRATPCRRAIAIGAPYVGATCAIAALTTAHIIAPSLNKPGRA